MAHRKESASVGDLVSSRLTSDLEGTYRQLPEHVVEEGDTQLDDGNVENDDVGDAENADGSSGTQPKSLESGMHLDTTMTKSAKASKKTKSKNPQGVSRKDKITQAPKTKEELMQIPKSKSSPTFADLAELTRHRDELLAMQEEENLTALLTGVGNKTVPMTPRTALRVEERRAIKTREIFLEFNRKRRGTGLRAWRLDLDKKGTNRVAYGDLVACCKQLGIAKIEARVIWHAYRPPKTGCPATPIEFHEFDPSEWKNLNEFLEVLWAEFNFDVDMIWGFLDVKGTGTVELNEFQAGLFRMGFFGDARHIFIGLDTAGKGKITKTDMYYFKYLQPESHGHPEESPLVKELKLWVDEAYGNSEVFMNKLGMRHGQSAMSVSSLARKLESLGFPGNCLHTAMTLSRCNHHIDRHDLLDVLGHAVTDASGNHIGDRTSRSYVGRHYDFERAPRAKKAHDTTAEKPPWNGSQHNFAPLNSVMGKREKHMFSMPFPRPVRDQIILERKQLRERLSPTANPGKTSNA